MVTRNTGQDTGAKKRKKLNPSPPLEVNFLAEPVTGSMPQEEFDRSRRFLVRVALVLLVLFGLLFLRLWYLQILEGENLKKRSEYNRIRVQDLNPWRGRILDRQGNILVDNRPSFDLKVVLEDVPDPALLGQRLSSLLHLNDKALTSQMEKAVQAGLQQVRLKTHLSWEEMALVETYKAELPGCHIQIAPTREYRQPGLAPHVLGYLGEITEAQLKSSRYPKYKMGDFLGRYGIEAAWEEYLRGQRGSRRIEVDAFGRELGKVNLKPSTPGANLYLTLDSGLQREAEDCLRDKVGAIVALNPQNGKILALASSPAFSHEAFAQGLNPVEWRNLVNHKYHPLLNRAIRGQYPPGSTFKIVMAVAGLEEKVITPKTYIHCSGSLTCGNHVFHCWRKAGHGSVDLHRALVASCDVYFYEVGRRLGIERIAKWSRRFGLGAPTGLKLGKEMPGLVASAAWKLARFRDHWREGDTLSVAIGQGYNLMTPLQVAQMAAVVANGGTVYEPQLVEKVESPAGEILYHFKPIVKSRLQAKPGNLALVRKALAGVVSYGTGKRAYLPRLKVAGKTGTSQVVSLEKEKSGKKIRKFQNHAWFVAYAPAEDPQLAVSVIVEHGGGGGEVAAPLARRVLAAYFQERHVAQTK